jgi:hypothetical protein
MCGYDNNKWSRKMTARKERAQDKKMVRELFSENMEELVSLKNQGMQRRQAEAFAVVTKALAQHPEIVKEFLTQRMSGVTYMFEQVEKFFKDYGIGFK